MEWGFILAIIGFAALLQLAFFLYFIKAGQSGDSVYPSAASESGEESSFNPTGQQSNASSQRPSTDESHLLTCQECGFENNWDAVFTYCANCTTQLG